LLLRTGAVARHLLSMRFPRTLAFLPTLAVLVLPKCPMCIAAYLTAVGCGAAFADAVAPILLGGVRLAAIGAVVAVAFWVSRYAFRALFVGRMP